MRNSLRASPRFINTRAQPTARHGFTRELLAVGIHVVRRCAQRVPYAISVTDALRHPRRYLYTLRNYPGVGGRTEHELSSALRAPGFARTKSGGGRNQGGRPPVFGNHLSSPFGSAVIAVPYPSLRIFPRSASKNTMASAHSTKVCSLHRCYAIVDEAMLKESASKLAAFHADEKNGTRKVVSVRRRRPQ